MPSIRLTIRSCSRLFMILNTDIHIRCPMNIGYTSRKQHFPYHPQNNKFNILLCVPNKFKITFQHASSGNRNRVPRMASVYSTTELMMLLTYFIKFKITFQHASSDNRNRVPRMASVYSTTELMMLLTYFIKFKITFQHASSGNRNRVPTHGKRIFYH